MIHCRPRGICSWNYDLDGDGHRGRLDFNAMSEQGRIVADGAGYEVRKHGVMSGRWTLEEGSSVILSAAKPSAFTRTFELDGLAGSFVLEAASAFGRTFHLRAGDGPIATLAPEHAFTRRAMITIEHDDCDFRAICFAFWLVALTWRRQQSSS
ncbi:MAG: hypothetical protein KDC98_17120 [Planctomycetes bacterium]|nr:hypothetical protein [Planctomycetota bacterium]